MDSITFVYKVKLFKLLNTMQTAAVKDHIVQWLKNYATNAKVNGFVVGVSGGVDSALTSTLCAETGFKVLCIEMPIHQASSQVTRAQNHIAWLKQKYPNISDNRTDLTPVFDTFVQQLPEVAEEKDRFLTLANARARLRMTTLYYYAGLHGLLVAGTGNKVEDFGVGFFTKYGDGGVDLSPIADLLKSEVYEIATHLGVINEILQAAPTDGLWGDDRTDEDQLGASYDELEWAMEIVDKQKDLTIFDGRKAKVLEKYLQLHRANKHKMIPIPLCKIPSQLK